MAVNIFVTNIDIENRRLCIALLFEYFERIVVLFGIMTFLDSAEDPFVIFIFKVVLLDKITALDEVFLEVTVRHFGCRGLSFSFGEPFLSLLNQ